MSRDGNGNYTLPQSAFVPNTTISSNAVNSDLSDIASALTGSVASDGQTPITGPIKFTNGTAAAPGISYVSDTATGIRNIGSGKQGIVGSGVDTIITDPTNVGTGKNGAQLYYGNTAILNPVGMIVDFAGSTAPLGWFLCYGQVVAQASYPELFFIIGTTYNTGGEGAGNFRLPDLRGRVTAGVDTMGGPAAGRITLIAGLGASGGTQQATVLQANLPAVALAITVNDTRTWGSNLTNAGTGSFQSSGACGADSTVNERAGVVVTSGSITATQPNLGSGAALTILDPMMLLNKIIFAGRP